MTRHHALKILGLPPHATDAQIKAAWRAKAKLFHPDSPYSDARGFMMAKRAYDALRDVPEQDLCRRIRVSAPSRRA